MNVALRVEDTDQADVFKVVPVVVNYNLQSLSKQCAVKAMSLRFQNRKFL